MRYDLITRLRADAAIAAIISNRVYWGKRKPADPLPCIVLHKITPGNQYTYDGASQTYGARIQFDCLAAEMRDALLLFEAVKAEMEQAAIVGDTAFSMSFMQSDRDIPFTDVAGAGTAGGISADFIVWFKSQ